MTIKHPIIILSLLPDLPFKHRQGQYAPVGVFRHMPVDTISTEMC